MPLKKLVAVRFTEAQHKELERISEEEGIGSVSTLIRSMVVQSLSSRKANASTPVVG